jgi:hypothetical protein
MIAHKSDIDEALAVLARTDPNALERYRTDRTYRRKVRAFAREARRWAKDALAKARQDILREVAEIVAISPDRVEGLHEDLLHDCMINPKFRSNLDWRARARAINMLSPTTRLPVK